MRMNQDRGRRREWIGQDPKLVQEWLRQNNLIYGGLIAIGVYMVQPFLVAGFWHILWIAGVGILAGGLVAVGVHSAGYMRVEQGHLPTPPDAEEPDDPEA
jgi:hypothetical protein